MRESRRKYINYCRYCGKEIKKRTTSIHCNNYECKIKWAKEHRGEIDNINSLSSNILASKKEKTIIKAKSKLAILKELKKIRNEKEKKENPEVLLKRVGYYV